MENGDNFERILIKFVKLERMKKKENVSISQEDKSNAYQQIISISTNQKSEKPCNKKKSTDFLPNFLKKNFFYSSMKHVSRHY